MTTVEKFFTEPYPTDVVLLNEYDVIINECPFIVQSSSIRGLWSLREKKVIAFSATTSPSYERFVHNCIASPKVLKFKSEYEMVHGSSPIVDPVIIPAKDRDSRDAASLSTVEKQYEKQPVILIVDDKERSRMKEVLSMRKYKVEEGGGQASLLTIRSWEYGILVLGKQEGRGVDTRFKKDAYVVINCDVDNYHEVQ